MIQYISYADLNEFYSIKEVCRLLEMDKENLRKSCEKYGVKPMYRHTCPTEYWQQRAESAAFRHSAAKSLSRPHAFRRVAPSVKVLEKSPEKQDIRRLSATDDTKIWLRRIGSSLCTALLLFRREQGIDRSCAVSVESHGWLRIWLRRLPGNTGETFVIPLHFDYSLKFCANFPYPLDFEWTPCYNPTWTISDVSFTEGATLRKIVASNDHKCNALARVSEEAALRGRDFFCR